MIRVANLFYLVLANLQKHIVIKCLGVKLQPWNIGKGTIWLYAAWQSLDDRKYRYKIGMSLALRLSIVTWVEREWSRTYLVRGP